MPTAAITIDPQSPGFDSPDDAASAVAAKFGPAGKPAEMAAMVYKDVDGKFKYSTLVPGKQDNFALQAQVPQGASLAGIVHSHPGVDDAAQVFSPDDLDTADKLKLPSYIRFLSADAVRRYTPGATHTALIRTPRSRWPVRTARGDDLPKRAANTASDSAQTASAAQTPTVPVEGHSMSDSTTGGQPIPSLGAGSAGASGTLNSLYTQNPGTTNAAAGQSTDPAAVTPTLATPSTVSTNGVLANAQQYTAAQNTVNPNQLASNQLADITSQDSPLMEQARQEGLDTANSRGMLNSTLAGGAAEASMVQNAAPLAEQNAATEANSSLANQAATNTAAQTNATMGTQVSEANAATASQINQLQAQMQTAVSQGNAQQANAIAEQLQQLQTQNSQFNAAQKTSVNQSNAQATNAMTAQVLSANSALNQQYLAGTQSMDLATIQGTYQNLISQNAAASSLFNSYMNSIAATMADTNLDPARAAQIVQVQQQTLASGLQLMDTMNSLYPGASNAPVGTGGAAPQGGVLSNGAATSGSPTNYGILPVGALSPNPKAAGGEAASTAGPNALAAAGGLTGLGALATSASKLNALQGTTTGGVLSSAGNLASGLGGAAGIYGGIKTGGVKGAGSAIAGGAQIANALGYGGTLSNSAGLVGNVASGNLMGAVQNAGALINGGGTAGLTTAQAAAESGAAQAAGAGAEATGSVVESTAPTQIGAYSADAGTTAGTAAGETGSTFGAGGSVAGALSTALPAYLAVQLGTGLLSGSGHDNPSGSDMQAVTNSWLNSSGPGIQYISGDGSAKYPLTVNLKDGTSITGAQYQQLQNTMLQLMQSDNSTRGTTSAWSGLTSQQNQQMSDLLKSYSKADPNALAAGQGSVATPAQVAAAAQNAAMQNYAQTQLMAAMKGMKYPG